MNKPRTDSLGPSLTQDVRFNRGLLAEPRHEGHDFTPAEFAWAVVSGFSLDYVIVNETEDSPGIAVLKPKSCRFNSDDYSEVQQILVNPDDSTFNTMTARLNPFGEELCEIRQPPYKIGDDLLIVRKKDGFGINDADGNLIVWADFNLEGRAWCRVDEWTISDGGGA